MAKQTLNILKGWFKQGFKPNQQQFWDVFDSFFHKDNEIAIGNITNLSTRLNEKADQSALEAIALNLNNRLNSAPIEASGVDDFVLEWTPERKQLFGIYARDFAVWIDGSLQQVPISFTVDEQGKPNAYTFNLGGLTAQIFII